MFAISCAYFLSAGTLASDLVTSLPTYKGPLKNKQYAGFAQVTPDGHNELHYWFVEADGGNVPGKTPFLMYATRKLEILVTSSRFLQPLILWARALAWTGG